MISRQFDALTLSFVTVRDIEVSQALNNVLDILKIGDLWPDFEYVGRDRFYPYVYRHNDISICLCSENRLRKQGICIRMSGNGLAFYQNYLQRQGETLKRVLRAWRASNFNGDFARVTRIDYAVDDICTAEETPKLTMQKVHNAVKNHEFRSRLLANRPKGKQYIEVDEDVNYRGSEKRGDTVYFGSRRSSLYCRFYDKLLEQVSHDVPVDDAVTSWTRCEFEFHDARSMAVVNAYCDMSDDDFAEYMSEVMNNYISFIVLRKDTNRSRCPVKRWWYEFLGTAERSSLQMPAYRPATFKGNTDWFQNISPSLYMYISTVGLRYFLQMIMKYGKDRVSTRHKQMQKDFLEQFVHNTSMSDNEAFKRSCDAAGLDIWLMTSHKSKKQVMREIQEDYKRFRTVNGLDWKEFPDRTEYKAKQLRIAEASEAFERDMFEFMGA